MNDSFRPKRPVTPEINCPDEFDQKHYLDVMANFKRWRTPSPLLLITDASATDSTSDGLNALRSDTRDDSSFTKSIFSSSFDPTVAVVPMSTTSSSESLVLGEPLFREEPDGSSGSLPFPDECSSASLGYPKDSTPEGEVLSGMSLANKVRNSIENLDKIAKNKKHRNLHANSHDSLSPDDHLRIHPNYLHLPENETKLISRQSGDDRMTLPGGSREDEAKEKSVDKMKERSNFFQGTTTTGSVPTESRIVLNLDSSRAATLTRTCKFGGYFRKIPESGDLTVNELREMATRQQQHIESQQQLLVAREQRLKYLKQQEGRTSQVNMETERLRRLRERVEAQEAKLRRLRALRGQVDNSRLNAASLYSDLDAMRHLFSEKEKELVDAAAKVEELTRQLEDVRGGRGISSSTQNGNVTSTSQLQIHHQELEKLRRELLYRNSVNREASTRVSSQKEALTTRKEEIARIDKRIAELTQRLHRKRVLNQQLTTQISAATQAKQAQLKAVQQKAIRDGKNDHAADGANIEDHRTLEDISQFDRGKHDPKYQTLPYNTKFSSGVKGGSGPGQRSNYENAGSENESNCSSSDSNPSHHQSASVVNNANIRNNGLVVSTSSSSASTLTNNSASNGSNGNLGVITSTVHSTPAHLATKSHALAPCPTNQSGIPTYAPTPAPGTQNFMARGQNSNAIGSISSNQSGLSSSQLYHQKLLPESCQPIPVSASIQKVNPSLILQQQNRNTVVPSVHPTQNSTNKDVENVRALGYPAAPLPPPMVSNPPHTLGYHSSNSTLASHQSSINNVASKSYTSGVVTSTSSGELQEENSDQSNGKLKPILPPKPVVPSKPTPPPRQKGDPMASSTESINLIGVSNHRSSVSNRPQVFRYASQNVILSTYTQQQQLVNQQISSTSREAQSNKTTPLTNQSSQPNEKQGQDPSKSKATISKESSETCDENSAPLEKVHVSMNRRIEMPPDFLFPEDASPPSDLLGRQLEDLARTDRAEVRVRPSEQTDESKRTPAEDVRSVPVAAEIELRGDENSKEDSSENNSFDTTDRINVSNHINSHNNTNINNLSNIFNNCVNNLNIANNNNMISNTKDMERLRIEEGEKGGVENEFDKFSDELDTEPQTAPSSHVVRRLKKGNLKTTNSSRIPRRVSFDPLALLLDASLEGELELVKRTATEVPNPSAANDEGITALHNAICAGHLDIVTFLVTFGCDVNAQDSDGWTPLHCAASCNNVAMVRFLVEHGACVLATTLSDHETAAEKCEQDEEGYDGCSQYLYSVQEKLGIMNGGVVYAVYEYDSQNDDELSFKCSDSLTVIRRGDEYERDWWWVRISDKCGYVPRNLLGLYPRVKNPLKTS